MEVQPAGCQELCHLLEEGIVIVNANVLEHADLADRVIFSVPRQRPIVAKFQPHLIAKLRGTGACFNKLCLTQGDAVDDGAISFGCVCGETAPAAADIEQFRPGFSWSF